MGLELKQEKSPYPEFLFYISYIESDVEQHTLVLAGYIMFHAHLLDNHQAAIIIKS